VQPSCGTPHALERVLDRVDRLDLREFLLPPDWEREKRRVFERTGEKPEILCSIRGPVTLAMSVYGVENLVYLLVDEPELGARFSDTILRVVRGAMDLMDAEAGHTNATRPHGFYFYDDDCCLLTPELYETFAFPILKSIFDHASPDPGDDRYQHSDSAMGHLLPVLARLGLTACNFGPTLTIDEIRRHLSTARIDGQLAPFTFQSNDEERIVAEVRRDCEAARRCGRGVCLDTAGSVNDGTRLTSLRAVMAAIQEYGRY
jgi:uroporphyrinogen decarboxylase